MADDDDHDDDDEDYDDDDEHGDDDGLDDERFILLPSVYVCVRSPLIITRRMPVTRAVYQSD